MKIWMPNFIRKLIGLKKPASPLPIMEPECKILGIDFKLEWVKTPEQMKKLQEFAATFEHEVRPSTSPWCIIKKHGQPIGYFQITREPVVFTAWHTNKEICSTRDMLEGYKLLSGWAKVQHGGGFAVVPCTTDTFYPHIMKKLGFKRCNGELYETTAD